MASYCRYPTNDRGLNPFILKTMYVVRFPKNIKDKLASLQKLGESNAEFVDKINNALAREYKKQLLRHIENQDLRWKALNPAYLREKERRGYSLKTLKATGVMKKAIKVHKTPDGYFTGITGDEKYEDGTSVSLVAHTHEYGSPSKKIPARPLFRPTRRKMLKNINNFVRTENTKYIKFLVRKLR